MARRHCHFGMRALLEWLGWVSAGPTGCKRVQGAGRAEKGWCMCRQRRRTRHNEADVSSHSRSRLRGGLTSERRVQQAVERR